ncbi:MAG: FtsK/SpoIIIE domain-containing protein [Ilumatobacteraceae bacterium]
MTHDWTLTWEAGPDAGGTAVVGCGTHVVGRAAGAAVQCDDAALEPHHLLIETSGDSVLLRQLTGRVPVRIDGEAISESVGIVTTARLEIGNSVLSVTRGDLTAPGSDVDPAHITVTPSGSVVVRGPRATARWTPDPVHPPDELTDRGDSSGGVLPALLALAGAGLVAVLLHQPMFLIFGALGAVVAFGTWGGHRFTIFRRRRHERRSRVEAVARYELAVTAQRSGFVAHHVVNDSTVVSARRSIERRTVELWARRATQDDAFAVAVGLGSLPWAPVADTATDRLRSPGDLGGVALIADLAIVADIGPTCRLAVRGTADRALATVRSLIVQLAANCGPADVRIVVVTREPARWRWLEQLPHAATASGSVAVVGESDLLDVVAEYDVAPQPHVVLVTDSAELLSARTSPMRRVVVGERSVALIVVVGSDEGVPHVCTSLLDLHGPVGARWHADVALACLPVEARCTGIGERSAARLVRCLSGLIDPEDPLGGVGGIPRDVTLLSVLPSCEPAAIAASWLAGGVDPVPRTPIGVASDGIVDIDLDRDGPHALLAGTTGAGKSELLRTLVAGLAVASSPDHLTFVLIDYKGGSTFDACALLPHVVGVVTDLDDRLAERALRCLHAELRRREQLLRVVGAADLAAYRRMTEAGPLPRLVVVIDEFAALVSEQPDFLHALVGIAQRGRSLGLHLILATQRPSGVISDDIRANTNLRLALRLHDTSDAIDVVGDHAPAAIPRGLAGRAVMRLGPDEVLTFQTARCTTPLTTGGSELDLLVAAVIAASAMVGARPPLSPWLAPLSTHLAVDAEQVSRGIVGVVDDPDHQQVAPLQWNRVDGNLLLAGAVGTGVTSTLALLGAVAATDGRGSHLYVVDGRGDDVFAVFAALPKCGGVVRLHERERLMRLIDRLADEVARRVAHPTAPRQPIVVLIDGLDAVRRALDDVGSLAQLEMLDTILALGAAHDVVAVCGVDRIAAIPSTVLAACAQRWVFHLTDPLDATTAGISACDVPRSIPGRIVVASSGLEAQLMIGAPPMQPCADGPDPTPIQCLSAHVPAGDLPPAQCRADDSLLPLGLRFGDGRVCTVDVPDGEHLLIVGPSRSGRSTALHRMMSAWRDAYPDGWWRVIAPRRTVIDEQHRHRSLGEILDDIPSTGRVLIAVDDAEMVDDVGGALASLAASRRHGLLIVATGKPDSLRQSYAHWTAVVRRSRLGIVTSAANDLDGDLLGVTLPRRLPIPPRPGLVWLVADGDVVLTQVAIDSKVEPS